MPLKSFMSEPMATFIGRAVGVDGRSTGAIVSVVRQIREHSSGFKRRNDCPMSVDFSWSIIAAYDLLKDAEKHRWKAAVAVGFAGNGVCQEVVEELDFRGCRAGSGKTRR